MYVEFAWQYDSTLRKCSITNLKTKIADYKVCDFFNVLFSMFSSSIAFDTTSGSERQ